MENNITSLDEQFRLDSIKLPTVPNSGTSSTSDSHTWMEWESAIANPVEKSLLKNDYNAVSVFDCGSYVVSKTGSITTMKLHKLLYYCQAWSLVWDEAPIFTQQIEAWANGPVIPTLFNYHRGSYSISHISIGNPNLLSSKQKETVDAVLDYYGEKSSQWLIELTHLEDPWKNARKGLLPQQRGNAIISHEAMAEYYSSL
jgi:uncharacterized phage-associated protein